jgi:hypothetical protein
MASLVKEIIMRIKKEFAPITITIDTEDELRDLQMIAKLARDASYRSVGGFFHSPSKCHHPLNDLTQRILDL